MTRRRFRILLGSLLIILALGVTSIPTGAEGNEQAKASDFQMDGTTLVKYTGTAKTVSVSDSVKSISPEAFADNTYITSLTIPDSVKEIGMGAFSGCSSLSEVKIGKGVEKIGNSAFSNCTALKTVSIGAGLDNLGTAVFLNDKNLTTVSFDASSGYVCEDSIIYSKDKTELIEVLPGRTAKTYKMPNTVTSIKPYAFYNCRNIETVELSGALDNILPYAFSSCTGLVSMDIPYSVKSIDIKSFENCVNLKDVTIRESVSYIADSAFDGCSKLNIIAPDGSYADKWFDNFDTSNVVIIENEEKEEEEKKEEPEYTETKVPVSEIPIPGQIGETIVAGRHAVFMINNTDSTVIGGISDPSETDSYSQIVSNTGELEGIIKTETNGKGLSLPKFAIIGDTIAAKAFYQDDTLTAYEIADDITRIDDFAFARSGLKEITIPDSVAEIGYGAFYHCDNLSQILVPSSVKKIEPSAFAKTRMLDNWLAYGSSDFLIMGDGILVAYRGTNSSVTIPDTVKQIGPECFKNHTEITDVTIPESVITVCEEAFYGCSSLKNVAGAMNVETIEDRAFAGCPLETVRIPENVKAIGLGAYNLEAAASPADERTAYFYGENVPTLTYNKTATRLTNDSYRIDALSGVKVAVIESENILRTGTVLDRNVSGFSGLICIITKEHDEYSNGTLKIIDCTLSAEEASAYTVPGSVTIFGKGYNFDNDELNSVLEMAKNGAYVQEEKPGQTIEISGTGKKYILNVKKGSSKLSDITDAYKRIYGDTVPANFTSYDISLQETDNEIMLSKLGKLSVTIDITLPDNMPTTNLHIICTDENSQLEDLPFEVKESDGKLKVFFDISHTGTYGMYSFNSTAVSKFNLDETPDTGDYIHPKWFLAVGLFALGLALILFKKKENISI